jgi:hypothetical protein
MPTATFQLCPPPQAEQVDNVCVWGRGVPKLSFRARLALLQVLSLIYVLGGTGPTIKFSVIMLLVCVKHMSLVSYVPHQCVWLVGNWAADRLSVSLRLGELN